MRGELGERLAPLGASWAGAQLEMVRITALVTDDLVVAEVGLAYVLGHGARRPAASRANG